MIVGLTSVARVNPYATLLIDELARKKGREAARKYLDEKNYVKVVLMPEAARPEHKAVLGSLGGR